MHPGQKIRKTPGADWGVRVIQPAASPIWWNPDGATPGAAAGGPCVGAYRAINTPGNPWPGGPTAYADTLINLPNPGVNDLVEGNGAVPWAAVTGWGFVAAAVQYFDTGLVPNDGWSVLVQFSGVANASYLFGAYGAINIRFAIRPALVTLQVYYFHGGQVIVGPQLLAGNLAMVSTIAAPGEAFRNGISDGAIPAWGGINALNLYLGCRNDAGVPLGFITADIESLAVYNATLTAPQVLARANAMAAL